MVTLILSRFTRSLILLFLLTGCMTTPISSIPKLMRLDFLTMNFEHVRVGLQLPAHLSLGSGDAVMIIRSVTDGVKGEIVETFALIEDKDAAARAQFHAEKRAGTATSVWRIKPEEVSRLATLQEKVRLSRIEGPRIRGVRRSRYCAPVSQAFSRPARSISRLTSSLRKMKTTLP